MANNKTRSLTRLCACTLLQFFEDGFVESISCNDYRKPISNWQQSNNNCVGISVCVPGGIYGLSVGDQFVVSKAIKSSTLPSEF